MVNFKDITGQNALSPIVGPSNLFQTLRHDKGIEYLRDVQGDVLDEWYRCRQKRDIVIKMNTGSGKTLVGLVILQSRLNEGKGPTLYLCPNRHLVSQVQQEADKLGIKHVDFDDNNLFPLEFHDSTAILITTVQRLFNGRSVFRVAGRPDPVNVGTILIDDAHTCVNTVRSQFTADLTKSSDVGQQLSSLFNNALRSQSVALLSDIKQGKHDVYLRVPYWSWQDSIHEVTEILSANSEVDELKFVWPFLKMGEVLDNSIATVSGHKFEITPRSVPITLIPSFDDAAHRIYMSATLVDDAALVKDFAANVEMVKNPIRPKIEGDIGERLVITPSLVDPRFEEDFTIDMVSRVRRDHGANAVVLVPSAARGNIWDSADTLTVPGMDISDAVARLTTSTANLAVFANRYDGIDLPDEACRVLVMDDLPREHRLANQIEATSRRQSPILRQQIAQRIEQGMGRGVRSRSDYCVVIICGKRLVSFMTETSNQQYFTNETRQQIKLGQELATILRVNGRDSETAILDLIAQCLNRDHYWRKYHSDALQGSAGNQPNRTQTFQLAARELEAWQFASRAQYRAAANAIGELINDSESLSEIDLGWYIQLQAEYLHHQSKTEAIDKQIKAHSLNPSLLKPLQGVSYRKMQTRNTEQASEILRWLGESIESNALIARANMTLESLAFELPHDAFEQAFEDLADIIGFEGDRPERDTGRGPDVHWRMTNGHHFVIEAKNQVALERQNIYKSEAEQLGHHSMWFENEYPGEVHTPILIHPSRMLAYDAYLGSDAIVIQKEQLERLVERIGRFVIELASRPIESWDIRDVENLVRTHNLRPNDLISQNIGKAPVRQSR